MKKNTIKKINDIWKLFVSNGVYENKQVALHIIILLFLKYLDENQIVKEKNAITLGIDIVNPFYGKEDNKARFHYLSKMDPDCAYELLNKVALPYLGTKYSFLNNFNFAIKQPLVVSKIIDNILILEINTIDKWNELINYIFYNKLPYRDSIFVKTPARLVELMCALAKPTVNDVVLDPCMGTGSFLFETLKYLKGKNEKDFINQNILRHINNHMLFGNETSEELYILTCINSIVNNLNISNFKQINSLSNDFNMRNSCDLILCVPPFREDLFYDQISEDLEPDLLLKKTSLLFMKLFYECLKVNGRCVCVVPNSMLNKQIKQFVFIRQLLVENATLDLIIHLPDNIFNPSFFSNTSIVVFRKIKSDQNNSTLFINLSKQDLKCSAKEHFDDLVLKISEKYQEFVTNKTIGKHTNLLENFEENINNCAIIDECKMASKNYSFDINSYNVVLNESSNEIDITNCLKDYKELQQQIDVLFDVLERKLK